MTTFKAWARRIAIDTGHEVETVKEIMDAIQDRCELTLLHGGQVTLPVGRLETVIMKPRKRHDVTTRSWIEMPARRKLRFVISRTFALRYRAKKYLTDSIDTLPDE